MTEEKHISDITPEEVDVIYLRLLGEIYTAFAFYVASTRAGNHEEAEQAYQHFQAMSEELKNFASTIRTQTAQQLETATDEAVAKAAGVYLHPTVRTRQ